MSTVRFRGSDIGVDLRSPSSGVSEIFRVLTCLHKIKMQMVNNLVVEMIMISNLENKGLSLWKI